MNSWNNFLQDNAGKGLGRKELQYMYKNMSAMLVTLHIDYVAQLHNEIQTLRKQLLQQQVSQEQEKNS